MRDIDGNFLRIAPTREDSAAQTGTSKTARRINQQGFIFDTRLSKFVVTRPHTGKILPTFGVVPITQTGQRGRGGFSIVIVFIF